MTSNVVLCKLCHLEITSLGTAFFDNGWHHRKCHNQLMDMRREAHVREGVLEHKQNKNRMEIEKNGD